MGISVALTPATTTVTVSKSMITNASFRTKKLPGMCPVFQAFTVWPIFFYIRIRLCAFIPSPQPTTNNQMVETRESRDQTDLYILRRCPQRGFRQFTAFSHPKTHIAADAPRCHTINLVNRARWRIECACVSTYLLCPHPLHTPTHLPISVLHHVFHTGFTTNYTPITAIFYMKGGYYTH